MPSGKRVLIGCAIGCGGLAVLVVALVGGFAVWVQGSRELLEPRTLLGSDTTGYVEWTLRAEDPGTQGFVHALIEAWQQVPAEASEALPGWLLGPLAERRARGAENRLLEMLPMVVAWTVQPGASPDEDLHLVTVSIEQLGNRLVLADWVLGLVLRRTQEVRIERHGREKIYSFSPKEGRPLSFFMRDAHVFITSDVETARTAVDRLTGAAAGGVPSATDELFRETEGRGPLRGAVSNERGELLRLWRPLAAELEVTTSDDEAWRELRGLSVAGGLAGDGSLDATLRFHGPDALWADRRAPELAMALQQALAAWSDLAPELRARPDGAVVEITLRLPDVPRALSRWSDDRDIKVGSGAITIDR